MPPGLDPVMAQSLTKDHVREKRKPAGDDVGSKIHRKKITLVFHGFFLNCLGLDHGISIMVILDASQKSGKMLEGMFIFNDRP